MRLRRQGGRKHERREGTLLSWRRDTQLSAVAPYLCRDAVRNPYRRSSGCQISTKEKIDDRNSETDIDRERNPF